MTRPRAGSLRVPAGWLAVAAVGAALFATAAQAQGQQRPQRPAGSQTTPSAPGAQQLARDLATCRENRDIAGLERACSSAIAQSANIAGLDKAGLGLLHFNRANGRLAAGNAVGAAQDLQQAADADYNPDLAYMMLGSVYLDRLGDLPQAEASFRQAMSQLRYVREAQLAIAEVRMRTLDATGKPDLAGALREIDAALRASPSDPEVHFRKALALAHGPAKDDAMRSFDEALRLDPGHADALLGRAKLKLDRKDRAGALADADAALATGPTAAATLTAIAHVYGRLGRTDRALATCEQALAADARAVAALACLGGARARRGELQQAAQLYDRALAINAASTEAWLGRAALKRRSGDLDTAIGDYGRVRELDRRSMPALVGLAATLADRGDLEQALTIANEAVTLAQGDPAGYQVRALVWSLRGDAVQARKDVEQAATLAGSIDADGLLARGTVAYMLGDAGRAAADAREAARIEPENGPAHRLLARALLKRGETEPAAAALARAETLLPNDWVVARLAGAIDLARKAYATAQRHLSRSLELNAACAETFAILARVHEGLGNIEAARSNYQLAQAKFDYDTDGRAAKVEAGRRLAALAVPVSVPAPPAPVSIPQTPPPTSDDRPVGRPPVPAVSASGPGAARPPVLPEPAKPAPPAEVKPGENVMCRLLGTWAGSAQTYTGLKVDLGCTPQK